MKKMLSVLIVPVFLMWWISLAASYTQEQRDAYEYAYSQHITTIDTIEKANLNGPLTRVAMAKMISYFAINVLWLQPQTSLNCSFSDVSASLDKQYNYGVTQACQLWLMWMWSDWKKSDKFDPYGTVTRWQFATAFSRALSQVDWNVIADGNPYYSTHLSYLHSKWIINSVSTPLPSAVEKRWNVMIMMMRASDINKNANVEIKIISEDDQLEKFSAENLAKLKDKWVIRWPKDAKITIVEFTELLCPYCQRQSQQWIINSVIQQFSGQVNSISRSFIIHWDEAAKLSLAMECIWELKPWIYHETLDNAFEVYPIDIDGLIKIAVDLGINRASLEMCINEWRYNQFITDIMGLWSQIGVNWTPSSIVINNETWEYKIILWAYPIEYFIEAVESLL